MTKEEKAVELAAKLMNMTNLGTIVTAEDILIKCSCEAELNFYYWRICRNGRK